MRLPLLLAAATALVGAASAQQFPPVPTQGTVYDGARLLSPDQAQSISELSRDYQRSTGSPIVVATLPSLSSVGAETMGIERYSAALFDQWRIGNRNENGGILLVVAKADHKARIELGKDWQHDYDAQADAVMRGTILPLFKQNRYAEGIVQGCQALSGIAQMAPGASAGPGGPPADVAPFRTDPMLEDGGQAASTGFPLIGLLCFGGPVLLIVLIAVARRGRSGYRRNVVNPGSTVYNAYEDPRGDSGAFIAGVIAGEIMSQPTFDPSPFETGPFDSGGFDSGGSDFGSFDSGSDGGGGASGDW